MKPCIECGDCCRYAVFPPGNIDWLESLPYDLRDELIESGFLEREKGIQSPCLWLEGTICSHYEYRPKFCRDFKRGSKECLGYIKITKLTINSTE